MSAPGDSSTRLPGIGPAERSLAQRQLFDAIAGGPRAQGPQAFPLTDVDGCLLGPFNAFLVAPRLGSALQALGASIRYETGFETRSREIAILVVAARLGSDFEWYAHARVGRAAGLSEQELACVLDGSFAALTGAELLIAKTTAALLLADDLNDAEYDAAVATFGQPGVFELTTLVGYYRTLALQLKVFRTDTPQE